MTPFQITLLVVLWLTVPTGIGLTVIAYGRIEDGLMTITWRKPKWLYLRRNLMVC